jgi:hypothetical protein
MALDVTPNVTTVLALVVMDPLSYLKKYLFFGFEEVAAHAGFQFIFGFGDDDDARYYSKGTLFVGTGC